MGWKHVGHLAAPLAPPTPVEPAQKSAKHLGAALFPPQIIRETQVQFQVCRCGKLCIHIWSCESTGGSAVTQVLHILLLAGGT